MAWEQVKEETICKCLKKGGVLDSGMEVVSCDLPDDPFQDLDNDDVENTEALQDLIDKFPSNSTCSAQECTNGEKLPTCQDMDDDTWEDTFISELGNEEIEQEPQEIYSEDDDHDND